MKNKTYLVFAGALLWILPLCLSGQNKEMKTRMEGKQTYKEITETFGQYAKTLPDGDDKQRLTKHFARWAWYASLHLGPGGEFVNTSQKIMEAVSGMSDAPLTTANGSWSFFGPSSSTNCNPCGGLNGNGRVDRIAFHPSDPNIIYVGTPAGGLWSTTNGGTSWMPLSNFIPSLGISGIVVDYSDPNTIYVLTGDGDTYLSSIKNAGYTKMSVGVLVSHDAGATWQQTGTMDTVDFTGFRLKQHPTHANILIAATSTGIYRTIDGGETWKHELGGLCYDVEFKPGSPDTLYASRTLDATNIKAFSHSFDAGESWYINNSTFDPPLCAESGRMEIAVTPDAPNNVYLLVGPGFPKTEANPGNHTFCGFYRSTNSGLDFSMLTNTPNLLAREDSTKDQSNYDMAVAVNPIDERIVITGGLVTFRSTNGGHTFHNLTTYTGTLPDHYVHPDIHDLAYNPLNNFLYAASDGGFYKSTDNGDHWTDLSAGINTTQFYHLGDFDGNKYAVLAGSQDNGVKYQDTNSSDFSHIIGGDGADGVIDYTDQKKGYAVMNSGLYHYTDFTTSTGYKVHKGGFFMQVEMHTSNHNIVYFADDTIFRYNATSGVTEIMSITASGTWALKTCPGDANRIYAAGGSGCYSATGKMYTSANSGDAWETISDNAGFPAAGFPRISHIGTEPGNSSHVYACFSGYTEGLKVLYSANSGGNWSNISYDLPNIPVWSIEVDAGNNVYIGCEIGVYYKAAGTTHWEPFYNGLPTVAVSDLAINEGEDQLLASTFGRGIWRSSLRGSCPESINISSNLAGPIFRSAFYSISMSSNVTGGAGTSVVLRSNGYVDLTPGFRANSDEGNKFSAILGPCDSGLPPVLITFPSSHPIPGQ